ncbi:MAG: hypothetical protein Q7J51_00765 [Sheuella sp.]|jgi:hypothetical protein|nr:hypothetical protein [Sheuella sp.]
MWWHLPLYLLMCVLVSFYGKHTRLGFWGILIVSVFFTPWLVGLGLVLLAPFSSNLFSPFKTKNLKIEV